MDNANGHVLHSDIAVNVQIERREDGSAHLRAKLGMMGARRYRVHDVVKIGVRVRRVDVESARATHRIVVQADQARWTYAFGPGERRELIAAEMERQLAASQYSNVCGHGMGPR